MAKVFYDSSLGPVQIGYDPQGITEIRLISAKSGDPQKNDLTDEAFRQLSEYFSGLRRTFDLPLNPVGTAFQRKVWDALLEIPYGETRTYKQIAEAVGNPKACRAVGQAVNRNPLWIVIPCHRVIGSDGSLTGFEGGLELKKKLLELENQA